MSTKRRTVEDEPYVCIRTLAARLGSGQALEAHAHAWGQLIYARAGVMTVWTEAGSWVAPPRWAIWVPGGMRHAIRFTGETELRTLYLSPDWSAGAPDHVQVVAVSDLLAALIQRATDIGMLDRRDPIELSMAQLILAEFQRRETTPLDLPAPSSEATRRAVALMRTPGEAPSTTQLAAAVGLSARTLERRFLAETGLTLALWRRHARLHDALRALAGGASVKQVAAASGYASASAFVAAFRAAFGTTPGRYFAPQV